MRCCSLGFYRLKRQAASVVPVDGEILREELEAAGLDWITIADQGAMRWQCKKFRLVSKQPPCEHPNRPGPPFRLLAPTTIFGRCNNSFGYGGMS